MQFYNYYGDHHWADMWVRGALDGTYVDFGSGRGDADFATMNDKDSRVQAAKKVCAAPRVPAPRCYAPKSAASAMRRARRT